MRDFSGTAGCIPASAICASLLRGEGGRGKRPENQGGENRWRKSGENGRGKSAVKRARGDAMVCKA